MVEVIDWPCDLLRLTYQRLFIQNVTRSAGRSLAGREQIVDTGSQYWTLSLTITLDWEEGRIKEFEALISEMCGQRNIAAICIHDAYEYGNAVSPQQVRHTDDTWFSDGTGYGESTGTQALSLRRAAAAGAVQVYTEVTDPARQALRVGDLFSVAGFLYRVVRRGNAGWVKFQPPLRQGLPEGAVLETSPVTGYFRLADDGQGARGRDLLGYGEPLTLNFVEAFDRP